MAGPVMVVCDLHYEMQIKGGVDESAALRWLGKMVNHHRPEWLLGCGDWGTAVTPEEMYRLLRRVPILTIYGNHENMPVLESLYNVATDDYLPVLMEDGRVYEVAGLRVAGINGIVSVKRRSRMGVPRRTPEEFLEAARRIRAAGGADVLLLHEAPYLPELFPRMAETPGALAALEAIRAAAPRLAVGGHMHGGYGAARVGGGTLYVHVDSSQASRHYLVIRLGEYVVEVWRDHGKVAEYGF